MGRWERWEEERVEEDAGGEGSGEALLEKTGATRRPDGMERGGRPENAKRNRGGQR